MRKAFTALLYASVAAAVFLAFVWPLVVSRDQDSVAYHAAAVGTLLVFFASLCVLCMLRLRAGGAARAD